ncbi:MULTISPECIES: YozE family protein [Chryseobacterium]|uniref:YozE family protein n=1 Tax=Chryseobacterium TaxID=59732 RepID=UPI00235A0DFD|nr:MULTISPECIES: YozE family protein [Chryseobacterium]MDC8102711.1 sterile alpha motif-like domain-containing protein [Chryseobacterium rhizosphaerae]
MTINEFITECSSLDSPIGDLANDITADKNFPLDKSNKEIFEYLDSQTRRGGTNDTFQRFFAEYLKKNNATLKFILDYLKKNNIQSIQDATDKNVAMRFIEPCGYMVTIPLGNQYPETIMKDMDELKILNRQPFDLADGGQIDSYMIDNPNLGMEGMTLRFCCQEFQFGFLLSLVD